MRYLEIILKLLFLAGSIFFIITKSVASPWFNIFLVVSIVLGIVLILNMDSSYRYPHTAATYWMRRVEGALLIIFAAVTAYLGF